MKKLVFISYSRNDHPYIVNSIRALINGTNLYKSWIDRDMPAGRDQEDEIKQKINQCEVFVFIVSEHSLESKWCCREIHQAVLWKKPFIPIVMSNCDIEKIPHPICDQNCIIMNDEDFENKLKGALSKATYIPHRKVPVEWFDTKPFPNNMSINEKWESKSEEEKQKLISEGINKDKHLTELMKIAILKDSDDVLLLGKSLRCLITIGNNPDEIAKIINHVLGTNL